MCARKLYEELLHLLSHISVLKDKYAAFGLSIATMESNISALLLQYLTFWSKKAIELFSTLQY